MNCSLDKNTPVISVVIPVYNTEKYLARCVDSILAQSYRQLEIILVNDASTDESTAIIERYVKLDERIKTVRHEKNRGLFQARLTGSELATGKYISFVDSDDYISVDWFRKLVRQAERTESDIVVGEWAFDVDSDGKYYCNLDQFRIQDYCLEGNEIKDAFMEMQGRNPSWTAVWNKLYRRDLWDNVYPLYREFSCTHGHMAMREDVAFSSALMLYAGKLTNIHCCYYFSVEHPKASTTVAENPEKNIHDASSAMKLFKSVLDSLGLSERYADQYDAWNQRIMAEVYRNLVLDQGKKKYKKKIFQAFGCKKEDINIETELFELVRTPLGKAWESWENLKQQIISERTEYVSFDIFDTLVQRPFLNPADLFDLLSEKFNESLSAYVDFRKIREFAESAARKASSFSEEITFDEIYQYILEHYAFDAGLIQTIKDYELELELKYCEQRAVGKELYDLACETGKKVIICSDMYLSQEIIGKLLNKNGYSCDKLYVSCEIGLSKARKTLYKHVQKDIGCGNGDAIMHIGDNYVSDVKNAADCGWRSGQVPKATEVLQGIDPNIYGGHAFTNVYLRPYLIQDNMLAFHEFTALKTMAGLVANRIYGNPFETVNCESDFNADPRMVGYAVLGPYLLSLCEWIHNIAKRNNIGTVHFVARDGYIIKQAFDAFGYPDVKSNYIRLSRKALMLADVECSDGLYSVFEKTYPPNLTPKKLAEYFDPIIPVSKKQELEEIFSENGLDFLKKLKEPEAQNLCIKIFIEQIVDMQMLREYKAKLKEYFSEFISPGDYLFDVGYSGRPEAALSNILGFPVGSLYIHTNNRAAGIRQEKYNCDCETYFAYKPSVSGVMREHLLMELGPSTIGYREVNGKMEPVLEPYESEYCSTFVTRILQENGLAFVKDYLSYFEGSRVMFNFQHSPMSALMEYYLHYAKPVDRQIFASLPFEDDIGIGRVKAVDIWSQEIATRTKIAIPKEQKTDDVIPGVYFDGTFMRMARLLNRRFPRDSGRRKLLAKLISLFIRKS